MRKIVSFLLIGILLFGVSSDLNAATKKKPAPKKTVKKVIKKAVKKSVKKPVKTVNKNLGGYEPIGVSIRSRGTSVLVTFSNLKGINAVNYILSYNTNGSPEGAIGSFTPRVSRTITRELLFGTCSAGVCRYHSNITDAVLEVTVSTKKGTFTRTYGIRL